MWTGIVIILAIVIGSLLMHAMPFLLQYPDYMCYEKGPNGLETYKEGFDCSPKNFCTNPNIRAEKVQSKTMISNWVTDFNLECAEPGVIPAFYLVLYVGLALGGMIIGPLVDSYGKKVIFIISSTVILIVYGLIILM